MDVVGVAPAAAGDGGDAYAIAFVNKGRSDVSHTTELASRELITPSKRFPPKLTSSGSGKTFFTSSPNTSSNEYPSTPDPKCGLARCVAFPPNAGLSRQAKSSLALHSEWYTKSSSMWPL